MQPFIWFWNTGRFDPRWVAAAASLAVVVVTFIAVLVLFHYARHTRTLAKTSRQGAEAAEAAAQAAIGQIQALIDKERARIFVFPTSDEVCQVNIRSQDQIGAHRFKLMNVGPTPAINVAVYYQAVATPFETRTERKGDSRASLDQVLAGNKEAILPVPIRSELSSDGTAPAKFYVHIWGEVVYNDVVTDIRRRTQFRFRATMMQSKSFGEATQEGEWLQFGAPDENSAT